MADVWAPEIATHYGEVFWTSQGNQPIPPEIVERFKGKVMAITGYEQVWLRVLSAYRRSPQSIQLCMRDDWVHWQDQVMVTPTGQPGVNPEQDVSVPINWYAPKPAPRCSVTSDMRVCTLQGLQSPL